MVGIHIKIRETQSAIREGAICTSATSTCNLANLKRNPENSIRARPHSKCILDLPNSAIALSTESIEDTTLIRELSINSKLNRDGIHEACGASDPTHQSWPFYVYHLTFVY